MNSSHTPPLSTQLYIGVDVHKRSWTVTILDDHQHLESFRINPSTDELIEYLKSRYRAAIYIVGYEVGFCGYSIFRELDSKGISCKVLHSADIPTTDRERKHKTDRIDSRKIARSLKDGTFNEICVPNEEREADRSLVRSRFHITKDLRVAKNRIKALLNIHNIDLPADVEASWTNNFIEWLSNIQLPQMSSSIVFKNQMRELVLLNNLHTEIESQIRTLSIADPYKDNVRILTSIPGVGLITAMTVVTEIGDMRRFNSFNHLKSYCGLAPNCYASGERHSINGNNVRGNIYLKTILIQSAWSTIRHDPALAFCYKELSSKMPSKKAIIKIAGKLLNRMRVVIDRHEEYSQGILR